MNAARTHTDGVRSDNTPTESMICAPDDQALVPCHSCGVMLDLDARRDPGDTDYKQLCASCFAVRRHTETAQALGDQTTVRLPVQLDTFVQIDQVLDQVLDALRTEREAKRRQPDPARPHPLNVLLGCAALLALSVPWWVGVVAIVRWLGG